MTNHLGAHVDALIRVRLGGVPHRRRECPATQAMTTPIPTIGLVLQFEPRHDAHAHRDDGAVTRRAGLAMSTEMSSSQKGPSRSWTGVAVGSSWTKGTTR